MKQPLADSYVCEDGTRYDVHSELIRGEPRFYWVMCHPPGNEPARVLVGGPDGSTNRRTVQGRARRIAADHDMGVRLSAMRA